MFNHDLQTGNQNIITNLPLPNSQHMVHPNSLLIDSFPTDFDLRAERRAVTLPASGEAKLSHVGASLGGMSWDHQTA